MMFCAGCYFGGSLFFLVNIKKMLSGLEIKNYSISFTMSKFQPLNSNPPSWRNPFLM
jgi:hypothetical protein